MPSRIFTAAKHPKSFVSLAGADHLLSRRSDAAYVANVIRAWAERYLDMPEAAPALPDDPETVVVRETRQGRFQQEITVGPHRLLADEPVEAGGLDSGPGPYDLVLAGLGACTAMTLRLYAERKALPLDQVTVELSHAKIHAADCEACETKEGMIDRIERAITLDRQARRRSAPAAHGDRRQMPGAPHADVGDRYPHRRTERGRAMTAENVDGEFGSAVRRKLKTCRANA